MIASSASPISMGPRVMPAVQVLVGVLALIFVVTGIAGLALYWPVEQQVCTLSASQCQSRLQFTTEQASAFAAQGIPLPLVATIRYLGLAVGDVAGMIIGLLLFWRRRSDPLALVTALLLTSYSISNGGPTGALTRIFPLLDAPVRVSTGAWFLLLLLFLILFPNGRIQPRWTLPLVPLGLGIVALSYLTSQIEMTPLLTAVVAFLLIGFFAATLVGQFVRYRRYSTPAERQQVKWVLFGIALMVAALTVSLLFVLSEPGDNPLLNFLGGFIGFNFGPSLLPIFLGIAILRSQLWDIDVIIRRTLVYGASSTLLLMVYFGSVVVLQQLFRALTGQGSDLAIIGSTLAIAALFIPLRNRIQSAIDHRFYRRKYNAAQVLASFAASARDEVDLARLTENLATVAAEAMQPESISIWLRATADKRRTEMKES